MPKATERTAAIPQPGTRIFWMLLFAYVLAIYLTLPVMRVLLRIIYDTIGRSQVIVSVNLLLGAGALTALVLILRHRCWRRLLLMALPLLGTGFYAATFEIPEERIHFLQYALLGALALRAIHVRHPLAILAAVLLAATVGLIDEIIQFYLPNRVDDWHDVWMNAVGGSLGVWFGRFFFWE